MKLNRLGWISLIAAGTLACSAIPFLRPTHTPVSTVVSIPPTLEVIATAIPFPTRGPTLAPAQPHSDFYATAVYGTSMGSFELKYPSDWIRKSEEIDLFSVCESEASDAPCFTVQMRETSADVQAFADEILAGLESSVSDYFAAPPFQSTTSDNLPIIWNYVEYTYHDQSRAGQLAFVVKGQQGYYISALASPEAYPGLEWLFTEMIMTMQFGE
jgi:hypothetical protein